MTDSWSFLFAENCNIFGAPTWVNDRRELKELLSQMESTAALHERLAQGSGMGFLMMKASSTVLGNPIDYHMSHAHPYRRWSAASLPSLRARAVDPTLSCVSL